MQGLPLVDIISKAYGLQNFQIVDAPEWVRTARLYDINATLPPTFVESSETAMLQAMLADRFQLKAHTTEREITTLALTLEDVTPGFARSGAWGSDAAKYLRYSHPSAASRCVPTLRCKNWRATFQGTCAGPCAI